jgi:hypothetical protein
MENEHEPRAFIKHADMDMEVVGDVRSKPRGPSS